MNRAESDAGGTLAAVVRLADMGTWLRGRTGTTRVLLVVGRHVLWIALFTLPSIVLWWHVWTGHPSSTLTCPCGDPAQEVWFMAWPAWAVAHGANPFFSTAVNVPHGANLLSNTAGTLVGLVLSPVTWLWGPVASTNVALTLAPGLSAWGCWLALRSFVDWKPGAIPAALVYGYSAALVTSLLFGHVSVSVLPVPPLLLASLYAIVVRQARTPWRDGLLLAGLIVVQFLISPEILVMCVLFAVVGLVVSAAVGWRTLRSRLPYAARSLGVGVGLSAALLAYPAWFGLAGPQAVSGVLFATSAIAGVYLSGYLSPGAYGELANSVTRFGGYYGPTGPPSNYLGWGTAVGTVAAVFFARRRPLVWLLVLLALVSMWLSLGSYLLGGTLVLWRGWMPWRTLSKLPVLKEILPDQLTPFTTLFIAFILALGAGRRLPAREGHEQEAVPPGGGDPGTGDARRRRGGTAPGLLDLRPALHGAIDSHSGMDGAQRAVTAPQHRPVDGAVRRVRVGATYVVAGGGRLALPARRRCHEDPECQRWAGGAGRAGLGPADPERSLGRGRGCRADGNGGPAVHRPRRLAGLACRRGGHRWPEPRPRLCVGLPHGGAGCGALVRPPGLGVEDTGGRPGRAPGLRWRAHPLRGHRSGIG